MNRNSCSKSCVVSLISSKQMQWLHQGRCEFTSPCSLSLKNRQLQQLREECERQACTHAPSEFQPSSMAFLR